MALMTLCRRAGEPATLSAGLRADNDKAQSSAFSALLYHACLKGHVRYLGLTVHTDIFLHRCLELPFTLHIHEYLKQVYVICCDVLKALSDIAYMMILCHNQLIRRQEKQMLLCSGQ